MRNMTKKLICVVLMLIMIISYMAPTMVYAAENTESQNSEEEKVEGNAEESTEGVSEESTEKENSEQQTVETKAKGISEYATTDKDIYAVWDDTTKTISLAWEQPTDGKASASIKDLKDFISTYKDSVICIDFTLKNENDEQVKIVLPEDSRGLFMNCSKLEHLIGEECLDTSKVTGMTSMFDGCSSLKEVDLSNFDTYNVTNMDGMFKGCSSLTELDVSNFNTYNVMSAQAMFQNCSKLENINIMMKHNTGHIIGISGMFSGCTSLTKIDLSNADFSSVTQLGGLFSGCTNLKEIDLSGVNFSKVTDIINPFSDCTNLEKINFSNVNMSKIENLTGFFASLTNLKEVNLSGTDFSAATNMSYLFPSCKKLESVDFTNIKTPNLTTIDGMFYNCTSLTEIDLSGLNLSNVKTVSGVFSGCTGLTKIDLSELDLSNITSINSMFAGCTGLKEADLSGINFGKLTNAGALFGGCNNLTKIDMSDCDFSSITNIGAIFVSCSALEELDLSNSIFASVTNVGGMLQDCKNLKKVIMNGTKFPSLTNTTGMFAGCTNLTEADLSNMEIPKVSSLDMFYNYTPNIEKIDMSNISAPNAQLVSPFAFLAKLKEVDLSGADFSGATNMNYMFSTSKSLETVKLDNMKIPNVTSAVGMFVACNKLKELDLNTLDLSNVTDINRMFEDCTELKTVNFGEVDLSNVTNVEGLFKRCSALEKMDFSNFDLSSVTKSDGMFSGCTGLKEVDFSNINLSNITNVIQMFQNCSSLTKVDLSGANMKNIENAGAWFANCTNLKEVDLSDTNFEELTSVSGLFANCTSLENVDFTNISAPNIVEIGGMFNNCSSLTELDLTDLNTTNVTEKTTGAFGGCTNLEKITLGEKVTKEALISLSENWYKNPEGKFYTNLSEVYDGAKMAATYTKDFQGSYLIWDEENKAIKIEEVNNIGESEITDYAIITDLKEFIETHKAEVETIDLTYDEIIELSDYSELFKDCTKLKEIVNLSNLDINSATDMSSMFENCSSLKELDFTGIMAGSATDMSSMFKNCTSLESLDLSEFWTGETTNMSSMFENCTSLETLNLTQFDYDTFGYTSYFMTGMVTDMSNMFKNCNSLTNLDLRGFTMTELNEDGMKDMFTGTTALKRIVLYGDISTLDSNCGLGGESWLRLSTGDVYTADELVESFDENMRDIYINGALNKHYYISASQLIDNLYEIHNPDKPVTAYCMNLSKIGFGSYLDRIDANDSETIEGLLDKDEGRTHGYAPLGSNMKEALITLMYYGYSNDAAGIMEKYNLTDEEFADVTQEAIWDFVDRYEEPAGPTKFTGNKLAAYNELVSQRYSNIPNADNLLLYVYKSWDETQQNMIALTSVDDGIYGGVEVSKVDEDGNPLAGAEFTIANEMTGETRKIVSNSDGIASICRTDMYEGLPEGIYMVTETKAPRGYELTDDYYEFQIYQSNTIEVIGYKNGTPDEGFMEFVDDEDENVIGGGIRIVKKADTEKTLANVEFTVYSDENCTNKIATLKTNAKGIAESGRKDFEPGTYYIKETKAPYGYKTSKKVYKVNVSKDAFAEIEVLNEAKIGTASIVAKKELKGADIKDYKFKFELVNDLGEVIQTKTNDKNGTITFDDIELKTSSGTYKNYVIREVIEDKDGIIYDTHKELVTVTILDDGNDELVCTPVYDEDGAVFVNEIDEKAQAEDTEKEEEPKDDDKNTATDSKEDKEEDKSAVSTNDKITMYIVMFIIASMTMVIVTKKHNKKSRK